MPREDVEAHRARDLPRRGRLRRHVHGQHDGLRRRGARACRCPARPPRPPSDRRRDGFARAPARPSCELLRQGITARQILTKRGVRERHRRGDGARRLDQRRAAPARHRARGRGRAARSTTSTGSATRVPHLADVKPFGRYVMTDVDRVGGIPVVMKALLDAGLLHGDALTVTGRTLAENLAEIDPPDPRRQDHPRDGRTRSTDRRPHDPARLAGPRGRGRQDGGLRRRRLRGHARGSSSGSGRRWTRSRTARSQPATSS